MRFLLFVNYGFFVTQYNGNFTITNVTKTLMIAGLTTKYGGEIAFKCKGGIFKAEGLICEGFNKAGLIIAMGL